MIIGANLLIALSAKSLNDLIINKQRYAVQHSTLVSHHTVLRVSVRMNSHQALLFSNS